MGRGFESLQARLSDGSDMVGVAQLVSAPDCGSGGRGFESLYPPYNGLSPSGKAQDFDSCIALVRIQLAQLAATPKEV